MMADVEGERMVQALEAAGLAWLMFNCALFVAMNFEDALQLSRSTIDRLKRAMTKGDTINQPRTLGLDAPKPKRWQ
jgi:hypothetical protein